MFYMWLFQENGYFFIGIMGVHKMPSLNTTPSFPKINSADEDSACTRNQVKQTEDVQNKLLINHRW